MKELLLASRVPSGIDARWFRELGVLVSERFGDLEPISIAFVDADEIRSLNARYRRKDMPTDVLSFSYEGDPESELSGEIILCESVMRQHAAEKKHSVTQEFQMLVIHGLLHILGFDHGLAADAAFMEATEKELYDGLVSRLAA